jgi:hypothetical protein
LKSQEVGANVRARIMEKAYGTFEHRQDQKIDEGAQ